MMGAPLIKQNYDKFSNESSVGTGRMGNYSIRVSRKEFPKIVAPVMDH